MDCKEMTAKKSTFEEELIRKGSIIYTNVGDSMMPLLRQGRELLIIKRPNEWSESGDDNTALKLKRLDVPLYKRDNGAYVLHRVLRVRKSDYVICGDNRYQREYGICDRQVIGVLSGIVRDGKEISVQDVRYRLYSHLWCDFFWIRAGILWTKRLPKRIRRKLSRRHNMRTQ